MLPRLEAEERLNRVSDGALASGMVPEREARRVRATLERVASGSEKPAAAPAREEDLAGMGIAFVVVDDPAVATASGAGPAGTGEARDG